MACLGLAAALTLAALYGSILALDPYGRRVAPGRAPGPMMDVNQRFMFPQLARSGLFDGAVFGTSTTRLLEPRELGAALGARFANLAINAGTPWEQLALARLFLRHEPRPRALVFGLDLAWCDPAADTDERRLTFRSFPPWLYDEDPWNDLPQLLTFKTLEIASRVALNRAGLLPARIRADGYEVFTPPEASFDLARARQHLWSDSIAIIARQDPPVRLSATEIAGLRLPALDWLAEFAASLSGETRLVLLMPPLHVAGQPARGSRDAAIDAVCKSRVAAALGRRATIIDYRRPSGLTEDDAKFWDKMHYRLPVASRIVRDIAAVLATGRAAEDGSYGLLSPPT